MEMKTGRFGIGHYPEVTQRAKTSGQTLNKLEQTAMAPFGKPSFQEDGNVAPMFCNALTANLPRALSESGV